MLRGIGVQWMTQCSMACKVGEGSQLVTDIHPKEFLANRGGLRGMTTGWGW